ncbi:kelch-like protein 12 isoform X2 [Arctopsyche grandis]|uniref:kelch-like protein 12 isoform X2 n=1 Tax=Arctopsyche grandis TaxID=121162 RepID=UPI00406D8304
MCDSIAHVKIIRNERHSSECLERMYELMSNGKMCDVSLLFNGMRHKVHSLVLAGCSDYFKFMFMDESSPREIPIQNVDSEATQIVLEYCYTGIINLNENTVMNILSVAALFQLQTLVGSCFEFMKNLINIKNCIQFLNVANSHSNMTFQSYVFDYVKMNFDEVSKSGEFLEIEINQLKRVLESDFLNVSSEAVVFSCVKRWIMHKEDRSQYVMPLMECIRLPFIPNEAIFNEVQPFCGTLSKCHQMITNTLQWILLPNSKTLKPSQTKARQSANTVIIVGSFNQNRSSIVEIFDPFKNEWISLFDMSVDRRAFGAVLLNDLLLIIGGYRGEKAVNTVESYNVNTKVKTVLPSLQTARTHVPAVYIGGFVYIAGGRDDRRSQAHLTEDEGQDKPLSTMERWDPDSKLWTFSTPMITPRECYGVAILGDEFYTVGGWAGGTASGATEAFCPANGKWRSCSAMLVKRNWPGIAALNGFLYALCGRSGYSPSLITYSSLERYDPTQNTWSIVGEFPELRYAVGMGAFGKNLLAIGGAVPNKGLVADVQEYDVNSRQWKRVANVLSPREATHVISVSMNWLK